MTISLATHAASAVSMDTIVTVKAVSEQPERAVQPLLQRALGWFGEVERVCSRFDPNSELFRLCTTQGESVPVSKLLFEAVRLGLTVAEASDGIFDPTVGRAQVRRGFNRNYVTGQHVEAPSAEDGVSYRDVVLDEDAQTITLRKPLLLDLGALAKGLAVDLAAQQLAELGSFAVNAGGDIYAGGLNEQGRPWQVGIEHPRADGLVCTLALRDAAVCTSGDYERPAADPGEHHLLDTRSGRSPKAVISCSVVASRAMVADALSTAAFIAGPEMGLRLLEEQGVDGLLVLPDLSTVTTAGFGRWRA